MVTNARFTDSMHRLAVLFAGLVAVQLTCADELPVFRVDAGCKAADPTGRSWGYAFADLQDGIDAAFNAGGGEVWVSAGVYRPVGEERDSSFELRPGVRLYGGFRGTEKERAGRNPKANRTILSGDIGAAGDESDNCYHVVTGATDTHIDGFIVSRGNANGLKQKGSGGALYIPEGTKKMSLADCTFEKNIAGWQGGAVYGERIELVATNCAFFSNGAASGGGISIRGESMLAISDSVFSANTASAAGGAINLENEPAAVIQNIRFLLNRSGGTGGAISVNVDADAALELSGCTFADNSAAETGGAVHLKGTFSPRLSDCHFTRNTAYTGTGGIAAEGGVLAVVQACTFTSNRGQDEIDLFHDEASKIFESQEALQAALEPEEKEPEPEPLRMLDDVYVYGLQNQKTALRGIIARKPVTVIASGDLTDTAFIESYRNIEALAGDFKPLEVQFFYLYGALAHPENNGYIRPFMLKERQRQVQLAESLLMTKTPWLCDCMDNQTWKELRRGDESNVFAFNAEGGELYRGSLDDMTALRNALQEAAGTPPSKTDPKKFHSPKVPALNPGKPDLLERIHFNPSKEHFAALRIVPADSSTPFYAKLRAEGDDNMLETGNGKLYLGFHLDPLYSMQWDNDSDPLEYVIWAPVGVAAPSTDSAPEIKATRYDNEPREFVLNTRQLDLSKPLKLRVAYTVYSPLQERSITVAQNYTIELERDPFGGKAYRRQIAHRDPPKRNTAPMPAQLRHLDMNDDGKLSRAELSGNLWSKFPDIDTNRDGFLSADEYSTYLMTR